MNDGLKLITLMRLCNDISNFMQTRSKSLMSKMSHMQNHVQKCHI